MTLETPQDSILWKQYLMAYEAFQMASFELWSKASEKFELIRRGLRNPSERAATLRFVEHLNTEDIKQLVYDLLEIACYSNGLTHLARKIILSLPHDWLR